MKTPYSRSQLFFALGLSVELLAALMDLLSDVSRAQGLAHYFSIPPFFMALFDWQSSERNRPWIPWGLFAGWGLIVLVSQLRGELSIASSLALSTFLGFGVLGGANLVRRPGSKLSENPAVSALLRSIVWGFIIIAGLFWLATSALGIFFCGACTNSQKVTFESLSPDGLYLVRVIRTDIDEGGFSSPTTAEKIVIRKRLWGSYLLRRIFDNVDGPLTYGWLEDSKGHWPGPTELILDLSPQDTLVSPIKAWDLSIHRN